MQTQSKYESGLTLNLWQGQLLTNLENFLSDFFRHTPSTSPAASSLAESLHQSEVDVDCKKPVDNKGKQLVSQQMGKCPMKPHK